MLKKYRFGFNVWGLVIFLLVMLPNFIWFAVPSPNDVLRSESVTPVIDMAGSIFQVLFMGCLCFLINEERDKLRFSPLIIASAICVLIYYVGWAMYYSGITAPYVIISLTLPPCLAFIFFALDRKNIPAVVFAAGFTVCHLIYGIVNFIL